MLSMTSLNDHSHSIGNCVTPHADQNNLASCEDVLLLSKRHPSKKLNQDHNSDDGSPKDSSTTPSTQSNSYPTHTCNSLSQSRHGGVLTSCSDFEITVTDVEKVVRKPTRHITAAPERDGRKNNVVTTPINAASVSPTTLTEENIQALVIHLPLPMATPLGIDIDMILPIVSYIQPHSPLRQHLAVGDILINIDGRNVMNLTHMELCSMLNGAPRKKNGRSNEVETQGEGTKLVFLPGKCRTKLLKTTTIEQPSEKQQSNHGPQDKIADHVKSCSYIIIEGNVEDTIERVDESSMMKEQTNESKSATSFVEITEKEDHNSGGKSHPSLLDEVPQQEVINDDSELLKHKPLSNFKHSSSNSSPITAATKTSLSSASITSEESRNNRNSGDMSATLVTNASSNREKIDGAELTSFRGNHLTPLECDCREQVVHVDEVCQPTAAPDKGHQQQAGTPTDESGKTKATPITSTIEENAEQKEARNHCNKEEQEGTLTKEEECKGDEHVTIAKAVEEDDVDNVGEESKPDQVDELDDRDRRRNERINRAQPRILSISIYPDVEEDVSTLFGGVWNKQLHYAAKRVEDNILHLMEKGAGGQVQKGYLQQRIVRSGANPKAYHDAKKTKDNTNAQIQQLRIERALMALCIFGVVGCIVFLVAVLR